LIIRESNIKYKEKIEVYKKYEKRLNACIDLHLRIFLNRINNKK